MMTKLLSIYATQLQHYFVMPRILVEIVLVCLNQITYFTLFSVSMLINKYAYIHLRTTNHICIVTLLERCIFIAIDSIVKFIQLPSSFLLKAATRGVL